MRSFAAAVLVLLLFQAPPGDCDLFDNAAYCDGGGSGGGGTTTTTTTTTPQSWHWGPWSRSGLDCSDGDPRYLRLMHWSDHSNVSPDEFVGTPPEGSILGAAVIYQQVCVSVGVEVETAWDVLVSAVEALPDPTIETSPAAQGVTGLDTWLWFAGPTTVGPVAVSWTDPTVGSTFDLEGRAWVGSVRWHVEPGIDLWATSNGYSDTSGVLGGPEAPNVTWTYEVSSADAGFPDGYPVTMVVTWEGEWRWRERGGPWEPWRPMASTAAIGVGLDFPVLEVVGVLDPP